MASSTSPFGSRDDRGNDPRHCRRHSTTMRGDTGEKLSLGGRRSPAPTARILPARGGICHANQEIASGPCRTGRRVSRWPPCRRSAPRGRPGRCAGGRSLGVYGSSSRGTPVGGSTLLASSDGGDDQAFFGVWTASSTSDKWKRYGRATAREPSGGISCRGRGLVKLSPERLPHDWPPWLTS